MTQLLAHADAAGGIDWAVSIDSTINRTHQHAATLPRTIELRQRRIAAVVPEPSDQQGCRKRRGSRGGRPVRYDTLAVAYRGGAVLAVSGWTEQQRGGGGVRGSDGTV